MHEWRGPLSKNTRIIIYCKSYVNADGSVLRFPVLEGYKMINGLGKKKKQNKVLLHYMHF